MHALAALTSAQHAMQVLCGVGTVCCSGRVLPPNLGLLHTKCALPAMTLEVPQAE
jgi:hypothetical protein